MKTENINNYFEKNLAEISERLTNELRLNIESSQPSVTLALYRSRFAINQIEKNLETYFSTADFRIERYYINKEDKNLLSQLKKRADPSKTIFFVSGVQFANPSLLSWLNIQRESLREYQFRILFFVTEEEEKILSQESPDFWSFRQSVLEITYIPPDGESIPDKFDSKDFIWGALDMSFANEIDRRISWREESVKLLDSPTSQSQLYEQSYILSALYWLKGDYIKSERSLDASLQIARRARDHEREFLCYIGLGNINAAKNNLNGARQNYEIARKVWRNKDHLVNISLGALLRMEAKFSESITLYFEVLKKINVTNISELKKEKNVLTDSINSLDMSCLLNGLGKAYSMQGRDNESLECFNASLLFQPNNPTALEWKNNSLKNLGQPLLEESNDSTKNSGDVLKKNYISPDTTQPVGWHVIR